MNIALFGYGKMGQLIERFAQKRGHHIQLIIDENNRGLPFANVTNIRDNVEQYWIKVG